MTKKRKPARNDPAPALRVRETAAEPFLAEIVAAGDFKARCLRIMDDIQARHSEVVITKYGKPVAKLVPVSDEVPDSFGWLRGTVAYRGDIVAPDHASWDGESND